VAVRAVYRREGCARRRVHRIIRAAVIAGMTVGVTATAGSRQVVTTRRGAVAQCALHSGVQASEWEAGVVVIERTVGPIGGVVTGGALRHRGSRGPRDSVCCRPEFVCCSSP
jgi:hypothetical protein